jgi:LacI family transcriptional regulator
LEEFLINADMHPARVEKILLARNIRGILIPPHGGLTLEWGDFHWENFCIVRFGHTIETPRAHLVTSDQLTDGLIAYENMWKKGYRRIGLVTRPRMRTRFGAGYLFSQMEALGSGHEARGARLQPLVLQHDDEPKERQLLKAWIKQHRPDALLTDIQEIYD